MDENPGGPRFRIGEEERPETILSVKEEVPEIKKVSHRITRFAILILLLVAAAFSMGYFELKKRFAQVHTEGTQGLDAVSRNIEVRFLSLLEEQKKMNTRLESKIRSMEKRASDLNASIQQAEKQVADLNASKPDKQELVKTSTKIDQSIAALKNELAGMSQSLPRMEKKLSSEMTQLAEAIGKLKIEMTRFQEEIQVLSLKKLDKAIFDVKIKSEQKAFQQMLDQATKDLTIRIQSLQKRLDTYEKNQTTSLPAAKSRSKTTETPPSTDQGPETIKEEPIKE